MIQRLFAGLMMVLAVACGVGSLVLFGAFPVGSIALVRMHWPLSGILLWDALLCLAFFLQHSGMVRRGFRDSISRIVPEHYHRAVYSIASGLLLTGVVLLWQPSGTHRYSPFCPGRTGPSGGVRRRAHSGCCVHLGRVRVTTSGPVRSRGDQRASSSNDGGVRVRHSWSIPMGAPPVVCCRNHSLLVVRRSDGRQVALQRALDGLGLHRGSTRREGSARGIW